MEIRGVGIVSVTHVEPVPVALLVRLAGTVERLPEARVAVVRGVPVPAIALDPREASAPIKVELALKHLLRARAMKRDPKDILLVTGMSGAGKSTVLRTLEDLGWEVVDNLPLLLLDRLLGAPLPEGAERSSQPLALGIGARTRDFDPDRIVKRIKKLREEHGHDIGTLFLDCSGGELERRYSETRRRHPLALDRPASDGIARERELLAPLRRWANRLIDTTNLTGNELAQQVRSTFSGDGLGEPTLAVTSLRFRPRAAAQRRSGVRHAFPAQSALGAGASSRNGPGQGCQRLCRGRPGL